MKPDSHQPEESSQTSEANDGAWKLLAQCPPVQVQRDFAEKLAQLAKNVPQEPAAALAGRLLAFPKLAALTAAAAAIAAGLFFLQSTPDTHSQPTLPIPLVAAVSETDLPDHALLLSDDDLAPEATTTATLQVDEELVAALAYEQTLAATDVSQFSDATLFALFAE